MPLNIARKMDGFAIELIEIFSFMDISINFAYI